MIHFIKPVSTLLLITVILAASLSAELDDTASVRNQLQTKKKALEDMRALLELDQASEQGARLTLEHAVTYRESLELLLKSALLKSVKERKNISGGIKTKEVTERLSGK